jgi:hypothetical protein
MSFQKAERTQHYLKSAIYGASGSGKTFSALRIAKGIADKIGSRVAVIDTEWGSSSMYADRFDFDVDVLSDRTIDGYIHSMTECVRAGYKVLVIDSLSHAWEELLMEVDRMKCGGNGNGMLAWAKASPKQNRFIQHIISLPCHVIVTMRSKTEWFIGERDGRKVVEKVGLAPRQREGIEYEFDLIMEIDATHTALIAKSRSERFQDRAIIKPDEGFGAELIAWLHEGTAPVNSAKRTGEDDHANQSSPPRSAPESIDTSAQPSGETAHNQARRKEERSALLADIKAFIDTGVFTKEEIAGIRKECVQCKTIRELEAVKRRVSNSVLAAQRKAASMGNGTPANIPKRGNDNQFDKDAEVYALRDEINDMLDTNMLTKDEIANIRKDCAECVEIGELEAVKQRVHEIVIYRTAQRKAAAMGKVAMWNF